MPAWKRTAGSEEGKGTVLRLYQRLPGAVRSMAVTARGMYLRSIRYDKHTDRLAQHALDKETWPVKRLEEWCSERLAFVLDRAAKSVPYYREQWAKRRSGACQ